MDKWKQDLIVKYLLAGESIKEIGKACGASNASVKKLAELHCIETRVPKRDMYGAEFRAKAVRLSRRIGCAAAARELGVSVSSIFNWRSAAAGETEVYKVGDREFTTQSEAVSYCVELAGGITVSTKLEV